MPKNNQDLTELARRLLDLRKRLTHNVEAAEEALREDVATPGKLSSVPTHPADQAAEGMDEQIAIAENEQHLLEQVEAALERVEQGTYGYCRSCSVAIDQERLDAIPYAPLCIECARREAGKL
jgi:DnaK suppressor protein